jgi:hypothetical protein
MTLNLIEKVDILGRFETLEVSFRGKNACFKERRNWARRWLPLLVFLGLTAGCDAFTDAATRIAYDIEAGEGRLGREAGARFSILHKTPSKSGECVGPYMVQLDMVGALIIWCKDDTGKTVSSHSTSYHARFVDTPETYILEKPAGSTLTIDIERRGNRAVVTNAY